MKKTRVSTWYYVKVNTESSASKTYKIGDSNQVAPCQVLRTEIYDYDVVQSQESCSMHVRTSTNKSQSRRNSESGVHVESVQGNLIVRVIRSLSFSLEIRFVLTR